MLRTLALLLLLGNLLLWAYGQGHLAPLGLAPHQAREPERLAQQVAPQALRVLNAPAPAAALTAAAPAPEPLPEPLLTPAAVAQATAEPTETLILPGVETALAPAPEPAPAPVLTPPTPTPAPAPPPPPAPATTVPTAGNACWQVRRLSSGQAALIRAALSERADLQGRWSLNEVRIAPRWLVYVGPLANERALQQRRAELTLAQIEHRSLAAPLAPGLALGTFSAREGAERALAQLRARGVTDARVLQERPESIVHTLVLNPISAAERRQLEAKAIWPPNALQPCP
ncbi:hypothetical protein [Serpentinimonas maccroryi]|uniref:hypothetical protein n=1 Tax=Serpentinimonas maccroryi TaxID=1458426 RepID=UPI0020334B93|nr:hypothetical protein [Serpentinimonas maccroryi]MCM2480141.1 SPOR domain-containing protein [Serpentinimonas maccroryi]